MTGYINNSLFFVGMEGSEVVTVRGLVRVYFNDGTFKTFNINNTTTAEQLCTLFAAKMRLSGRHFTLYESLVANIMLLLKRRMDIHLL